MTSNPSKLFCNKSPSLLLNLYNIISLIILICCIVVIACVYTFSYLKEEKLRANISLQQFEHFFDFQYRAMSQEFWTGNYDSISMRVDDIAKKFGNAKYGFYILDNMGNCLASAKTNEDALSRSCAAPKSVKDLFNKYHDMYKDIRFDLNLNKYVYFSSLKIDPQKYGYIYVEMSDPYNFYRGSLLSKLWGGFFLKLVAVVLIWLFWLLVSKKLILGPYFKAMAKSEKNEALGRLAAQVAHDIQSPLAALEMMIQSMSTISENKRILIRSAVSRVRDIANNLLSTHRKAKENLKFYGDATDNEPLTCQLAANLIENILTEKRLEFRSKIAIKIESFLYTENGYGLFIKVQLNNFKRVISNIINNSVESIVNSGVVTVTLKQNTTDAEIIVEDTGIGISPRVLNMLGQPGITHGKSKGNGLGIYHAKKILSDCGGNLNIDSILNKGTTVKITLPKAKQPAWFTSSLVIKPNSVICIIDDDASIHQIWKRRLLDENISATHHALSINHFSSPSELITWHSKSKSLNNDILYLCDYEFLQNSITGIEVIRRINIESSSVLVTSHYEEPKIQNACLHLGIKLLPKSMAAFIPLIFQCSDS